MAFEMQAVEFKFVVFFQITCPTIGVKHLLAIKL